MRGGKHKFFEIIDAYVRVFESADADLMKNLFWFDDSKFIEVENYIPGPFSCEKFLWIMNWIRKH